MTYGIYDKSALDFAVTRTGRPRKPEQLRRSKLVAVKMTIEEHRQLTKLAKAAGLSVSDLLREGGQILGQKLTKGKGGSAERRRINDPS